MEIPHLKIFLGFGIVLADSVRYFIIYIKKEKKENQEYIPVSKIQKFFNERFFDKRNVITDEFLTHIMEIKQVFIGGELDVISTSELIKINNFIKLFKNRTLLIHPHIKVYNGSKKARDKELDEALAALKKAFEYIQLNNSSEQRSYSFSRLESFLNIINKQQGNINLDKIIKVIPFIKKLKTIVLHGDEDKIEGYQWRRVLRHLSVYYSTLVIYEQRVKDKKFHDFLKTKNLIYVDKLVSSLARFLNEILNIHPGQTIDPILFSEVFDHLPLVTDISKDKVYTLKTTWPKFLERLNFQIDLDSQEFNKHILETLYSEYREWSDTQKYVNLNWQNVCKPTIKSNHIPKQILRHFDYFVSAVNCSEKSVFL